jgi:hypothetical protein
VDDPLPARHRSWRGLGDYLLRPSGDLVEVGSWARRAPARHHEGRAAARAALGRRRAEVGDQVAALKAVEGLEVAEDLRGG